VHFQLPAPSLLFAVSFHYFYFKIMRLNNKQLQLQQLKKNLTANRIAGIQFGQHDVYVLCFALLPKSCYAKMVLLNLIYALANSKIANNLNINSTQV